MSYKHLSHISYQYVDISPANRIRAREMRTDEQKEVFEMAILRTHIQFICLFLYVEANQAFGELINLFDSYDRLMICVIKKVPPITLLQVFYFQSFITLQSLA